MSVNVGTVGHIDHGRRVLVVDNVGISKRLLWAIMASSMASPGFELPSLPAPKPLKRITDADLERIEAAEAKRQRRIERNQQRSS